MSSLLPSKCILLLTDDSLCIYKASPTGVRLVQSYGWRTPDFELNVSTTLKKEVGTGSVYILNDTVEQHYRKEKLGKLPFADRNNILTRRLNIAFPSYPTRAALELKDKNKLRSAEPEKLFLFSAVPSTDFFRKLLDAIKRSECTVASYSLLPVESVDLVDKIAKKVAQETRQSRASDWSILIGQHQGGGLRQVVSKNGQIALTRITPVSLPEPDNGAVWASEVIQEIQSTISYLARFGYTQEDGLDIMLMGKPDFASLVEGMINFPCYFHSLTVQAAAEAAGVKIDQKLDQYYAETLYIAWFAKKARPVMPMKSKEMDAVANPRKQAFFALLLLTAALGYLSFGLSQELQALNFARANLEEVTKMQSLADQIYDEEIKRKESLGIDIKLIQGSIAISQEFDRQSFDPLPVLEVVGQQLGELRVNTIRMEQQDAMSVIPVDPNVAIAATQTPEKQVSLIFTFNFPGTIQPQDGNEKIAALRNRISKNLTGYHVRVSKQLADLTFTGIVTNETGITAAKRDAAEVYTGEITIQKEAANASNPGPQ